MEKEFIENQTVEEVIVSTLRKIKPQIKKIKNNLNEDDYLQRKIN
jgi:hypothetical protein